MTCKNDCLHYDICHAVKTAGEFHAYAEFCKTFKNKADFVEVVRCKDCVEYTTYDKCLGWCNELQRCVLLDSFCSYGVKNDFKEN